MRQLVAIVVGVALLVGACSGSDDETEARTFYESLDLSTPGTAAETFVEAFAADDFMTVWMTFDHFAQQEIRNAIQLLQYRRVVRSDLIPDLGERLADQFSAAITETVDMWYIFDRLMLVADANDAFLIDLTRPRSLQPAETSPAVGADVIAELEGIEGEVTIRLSESPSGRWRVHQVIVPGGNEDQIPWSVPATDG